MTGIQWTIIILTIVISTNGFIIDWFNKITRYNDVDLHYYSGWFVLSCIIFCVFMIPFYKPIREYRKIYFIKKSVRRYEYWETSLSEFGEIRRRLGDSQYERYIEQKRYLKLKELRKKTKKGRIWN